MHDQSHDCQLDNGTRLVPAREKSAIAVSPAAATRSASSTLSCPERRACTATEQPSSPSQSSTAQLTTLGKRKRSSEILQDDEKITAEDLSLVAGPSQGTRLDGVQVAAASSKSALASPSTTNITIQDSPYCTQKCLKRLLRPGRADPTCPNQAAHSSHAQSSQPLTAKDLHQRLRAQLAVRAEGLPSDYDWGCYVLPFAVGNAFVLKIRLDASGHVFLAKGFSDLRRLRREGSRYARLRHLQGTHVPVCLGDMELQGDEILKYDTWEGERVITGLLLLGWAGHGVDHWRNLGLGKADEADHAFVRDMTSEVRKALAETHKVGIWHRDVALRNVLLRHIEPVDDSSSGPRWDLQVTLIDFELSWTRSKFRQYRRHVLRGTEAESKSDQELDEEFAAKLDEETSLCAAKMEEWCSAMHVQGRCPHPCHGDRVPTSSTPYRI